MIDALNTIGYWLIITIASIAYVAALFTWAWFVPYALTTLYAVDSGNYAAILVPIGIQATGLTLFLLFQGALNHRDGQPFFRERF